METPITKTVERLEALAGKLGEAYRADLEHDLGEGFSVSSLSYYDLNPSVEDHFYKLEYDGCYVGIIMPIRKKAFCGERGYSIFERVYGALERRGYSVTRASNDAWNLVEMGRRGD